MSFRAAWRRLLLILVAIALPAGGCVARVVVEGRAELAEAIVLRDEDRAASVLHARRAASWYLPFAPHVGEAYRELSELAVSSERGGDRETALYAWRSIRAASLTSRWLIEPHRKDRKRADAAIARLSAEERPSIAERGSSQRDLERLHASWLSRNDTPRPGWVLVLLIGLAGWAGGACWMVSRGMTREGRLVPQIAKRAAMVIAAGVGLFVMGLWLA